MHSELTAAQDLSLQWLDSIEAGTPLYSEIAEENVQMSYCTAYNLYQRQQYEEALQFFRLLVWVRPLEAKYWKGLGACLQVLKDYEEALESYDYCQTLHSEPDPYISIHQADCYFALNQAQAGLDVLAMAQRQAKKIQNTQIMDHVDLMRELWSKSIE